MFNSQLKKKLSITFLNLSKVSFNESDTLNLF